MGRPPRTKPKAQETSQLNAALPEQLLLEFNEFSADKKRWHGKRDDLLKLVLKTFLDSARKGPRRANPRKEWLEEQVRLASSEAGDAVRVITFARRHAEAIVDATEPKRNQG